MQDKNNLEEEVMLANQEKERLKQVRLFSDEKHFSRGFKFHNIS